MFLLYEHDQMVGEWVARRIPQMHGQLWSGASAAIGVVDRDIVAGAVWHNYVPAYGSIEVSFAADSPRWATRSIVCDLLSYPFLALRCQRINAFTTADNTAARKLLKKLGFVEEGILRRGFGRQDAVLTGLLVEDWIAGPFGRVAIDRKAA